MVALPATFIVKERSNNPSRWIIEDLIISQHITDKHSKAKSETCTLLFPLFF
jgi:hypothetical protein